MSATGAGVNISVSDSESGIDERASSATRWAQCYRCHQLSEGLEKIRAIRPRPRKLESSIWWNDYTMKKRTEQTNTTADKKTKKGDGTHQSFFCFFFAGPSPSSAGFFGLGFGFGLGFSSSSTLIAASSSSLSLPFFAFAFFLGGASPSEAFFFFLGLSPALPFFFDTRAMSRSPLASETEAAPSSSDSDEEDGEPSSEDEAWKSSSVVMRQS